MTKKDLTAIAWGRPKWVGEYRTWLGNRGEYKVTYNTTFQGIKVPGPHYMAFFRREGTKDIYEFVVMHKRYRTLNAAQTACLEHARKKCRSMNTNAPVATRPKNSKRNLEVLATALRAGRSKDSSEASAKSGSLNLEALLSRNTRGARAKAEGSETRALSIRQPNGRMLRQQLLMLYGVLENTSNGIEHGLQQLGMDCRDFDVNEIEDQLLDLNLERCAGCDWWVESGELVPSEGDKNDLTGCCQDCRDYL